MTALYGGSEATALVKLPARRDFCAGLQELPR
jgi:hypothetical protein